MKAAIRKTEVIDLAAKKCKACEGLSGNGFICAAKIDALLEL
jgi:hypothetical protein